MKRPSTATVLGFITGVLCLALLAATGVMHGCTGPSQTTTGYIEWNIQPSTTSSPNGTTQRAPTAPQLPR